MRGWSPRAEQTLREDKRTAAAHQRVPKKTLSICGPNLYRTPTAWQQAAPLAPRPPVAHSAWSLRWFGLVLNFTLRNIGAAMHACMHACTHTHTHARAHTR